MSVRKFFIQKSKTNLSKHRYSNNHRCVSLVSHHNLSRSSGDVNVLQWNRAWLFFRRVKFDSGFNVISVYEVSWHGPEIVHSFTGIQKWVLRLWWRPSDSPRKSILLSPWIGRCRTKVDVLRSWSLPGFLIRPSAIGKINSPSLGNITSFALSLFD